jgi:hypothetical protein
MPSFPRCLASMRVTYKPWVRFESIAICRAAAEIRPRTLARPWSVGCSEKRPRDDSAQGRAW